MAPTKSAVITEYICTWCGKKVKQTKGEGRPGPGSCTRKPRGSDDRMKPHTWAINRKISL